MKYLWGICMNSKLKDKLVFLSLALSILLTGCGDLDKENEEKNEKYIVEQTSNMEQKAVSMTNSEIFGTVDVSDYGFYDETMVKGLEITKPLGIRLEELEALDKEAEYEVTKYIMKETHNIIFTNDEYMEITSFFKDIKDTASKILTDEEIRNSTFFEIVKTYESFDGLAKFSEKRVYIKYTRDGEEKVLSIIDQIFSDSNKENLVCVRVIKNNDTYDVVGSYIDPKGVLTFDRAISIGAFIGNDFDDISMIQEFSIPKGVYTEKDLLNLAKVSEKRLKKSF